MSNRKALQLFGTTLDDLGGDDYGLWEVVWQANTLWPMATASEVYRTVLATLQMLRDTGLVSLACDGTAVAWSSIPDLARVAPLDGTHYADTRWWLKVEDPAALRDYTRLHHARDGA